MTQSIRKQRFIDYLDNNMFSHAYLFEVGNYDKDYKFILEFVKLLFCKDKKFNELNCNDCNICNLIDEEKFPDLYIVRAEGNEIKKEQLINLENEFSFSGDTDVRFWNQYASHLDHPRPDSRQRCAIPPYRHRRTSNGR